MFMPSLFGESLLDDFFDVPVFSKRSGFGNTTNNIMHTDVKETNYGYEIDMNLPGVKKEDVHAELTDGYLTVQATTNSSINLQDDNGHYIRRERYTGSCNRSFFVGEQVTQEDIKAKFEDGVLRIAVPKKKAQSRIEDNNYITIEG